MELINFTAQDFKNLLDIIDVSFICKGLFCLDDLLSVLDYLNINILTITHSNKITSFLVYETEPNAIYIHLLCSSIKGQGSILLDQIKLKNKIIRLEPANRDLICYYEKQGFILLSNGLMQYG